MEDDEVIEGDVVEGEIVNGTWINPAIAADDPRRQEAQGRPVSSYSLPEGRPSFVRMIFGSIVMVSEEVVERASIYGDEDAPRQLVEAAIHQGAEQQEALEHRRFANLRYAAIGFLGGALDGAQDGAGRLSNMTDAATRAAGKIISPIWNSFLLEPFHVPVKRAETAGENKVDEWIRRGRVEEVRSRALAEVSINNFIEESVTDLTENDQVQLIVQQVIASQSTGLATEMLEEMRERLVSLDILLVGKLNRDLVARPDFREAYLDQLAERHPRFHRLGMSQTLAGTYAGPVTRLVAFLVDVIILLLVVGLISAFVSSTLNLFGLTDRAVNFLFSGGIVSTIVLFIAIAFNFIVIGAYFILAWNWTGATVGDALFGLHVVSKRGERVSILHSIMRLIGMYISVIVFLLGFIWALFDRRRQGWHDKLGGTFVLYAWPAQPDERFLNAQVTAELDESGSAG
ncbi:MAG: RDD family protein [Candidatus Promineifilaceae bacterium]|jgi:uncharacterized RDD family membrane protein YckC